MHEWPTSWQELGVWGRWPPRVRSLPVLGQQEWLPKWTNFWFTERSFACRTGPTCSGQSCRSAHTALLEFASVEHFPQVRSNQIQSPRTLNPKPGQIESNSKPPCPKSQTRSDRIQSRSLLDKHVHICTAGRSNHMIRIQSFTLNTLNSMNESLCHCAVARHTQETWVVTCESQAGSHECATQN